MSYPLKERFFFFFLNSETNYRKSPFVLSLWLQSAKKRCCQCRVMHVIWLHWEGIYDFLLGENRKRAKIEKASPM